MDQTRNQPPAQIAWVIWAALLASIIMYVGIGLFLRQQGGGAQFAGELGVLRVALLVASFGVSAVNLLLPRLIGRNLQFFQLSIMRWAFSESIAIFGFVLFFLGDTLEVFLLFVAWALGFFLLLAPTRSARQRHAQTRGEVTPIG